ncbi:MAG TPA: hypothetical protein VHG08_10350 [Longimicrobium sp.]|nr:hypothetical protein [Longimicrobium sp.]
MTMPPVQVQAPAELRADRAAFAWNLLTELRKELIETQSLRTRVIGLKVAFVSAAAGLIAGLQQVNPMLMVVPAFAAIFFDVLTNSYSFSVKRIGWYIRVYLEPILRGEYQIDERTPMWEEFMRWSSARQYSATLGNLGFTFLACAAAAVALSPFDTPLSRSLGAVLLLLFVADVCHSDFVKRGKFEQPKQRVQIPSVHKPSPAADPQT